MTITGDRIKEMRIKKGFSQEALGNLVGYKSRTTLNKIESGQSKISQDKVVQFAHVLGTTPQYLLGWTDDPRREIEFEDDTLSSWITSLELTEEEETEIRSYIEFIISKRK